MPIYDYLCNECGHKAEEFQSIHAEPLEKCPECSSETFHRVIGAPLLICVQGGTTNIGSLADRNASRFSQEYKDKLLKKHKTRKDRSGKELPAGMSRGESEATPVQWPGETVSTDKVAQMTPEQKKTYVETGENNG